MTNDKFGRSDSQFQRLRPLALRVALRPAHAMVSIKVMAAVAIAFSNWKLFLFAKGCHIQSFCKQSHLLQTDFSTHVLRTRLFEAYAPSHIIFRYVPLDAQPIDVLAIRGPRIRIIGYDEVYYGLRAHTTYLLHPLLLDTTMPQAFLTVIDQVLDPRRVEIPGAVPILADQQIAADPIAAIGATTIRASQYLQVPASSGLSMSAARSWPCTCGKCLL